MKSNFLGFRESALASRCVWFSRLLFILTLVCLPLSATADGCFVFKWNKAIDINELTQKGIIVYDAGRQDMLLQVKYEGPLDEFGWLIPVPSEPKVERGSMEPFYELSQLTQPRFGSGKSGEALVSPAGRGAEPVKLHSLLISFDTLRGVFPLEISAVGSKPSEVSRYVLSGEPLGDT